MADTIPARTWYSPGGRGFSSPELRIIGHSTHEYPLPEVLACWGKGHYIFDHDGYRECHACAIAWTTDATPEQLKADAHSRSLTEWAASGGTWD